MASSQTTSFSVPLVFPLTPFPQFLVVRQHKHETNILHFFEGRLEPHRAYSFLCQGMFRCPAVGCLGRLCTHKHQHLNKHQAPSTKHVPQHLRPIYIFPFPRYSLCRASSSHPILFLQTPRGTLHVVVYLNLTLVVQYSLLLQPSVYSV